MNDGEFHLAFPDWFNTLKTYKGSNGPAKGTIAAALVVLEQLKSNYRLDLADYRAAGGSQLKGISGSAVSRILNSFGEYRPFVLEGGRTNRGLPAEIRSLLETLKKLHLDDLPIDMRNEILHQFQGFLTSKVTEYHNRQRLKIIYDPVKSTWQSIYNLLLIAKDSGKEGPVAQYLVGAKLQLRFPNITVGNESFSTADVQLGRHGDFIIGDTAFHVTVSPMIGVYEKCKRNIENGLRVYLLVPDRSLVGARQNAEAILPGRIAVESIESFVSQNLDELNNFNKTDLAKGFKSILELYNQRVNATEIDKSMLIEIPEHL